MQDQSISLVKQVLVPFGTFAAMFIGTGFISGSIVHLGEGMNMWDISLLFVGVLLFTSSSYVQEVYFQGKRFVDIRTLRFLFFSLLLSLGIGMASGGMQHFTDTPSYAAILIPCGFFLGLFAFLFKQDIRMPRNQFFKVVGISIVVFFFIIVGLRYIAHVLEDRSLPLHEHTHSH